MYHMIRPAWRNQWLAIIIEALLFLLSILMFIGTAASEELVYRVSVGLFPLIFVVVAIVILYRRYSWRFTITNETIESSYGIISRNVKSIRVKDLRNVNLKQSILQRIFGVGDLEFSSSGGVGIEVSFYGITKPMEIKNQIQKLQGVVDKKSTGKV